MHQNCRTLITDQYGNYVIQHVLEHGLPEDKLRIIQEVRSDFVRYAQHKFASNVVEKALSNGNQEERMTIINDVIE